MLSVFSSTFIRVFFLIFCHAIFLRFLVRVSYLEIYNESVRDLLGKDQKAQLEVMQLNYIFDERRNLA